MPTGPIVCELNTNAHADAHRRADLTHVQALVAQGRSVLLSAHTNAALDNMLRRLVQLGETRLLRLGRTDSVHPDVAPFVLGVPNTGIKSAALAIRQHVRCPRPDQLCQSKARHHA